MTAIIEDTDLSWVRFSDDDDAEKCEAAQDDCPAEAVAAAFWRRGCRCAPDRQPLCVEHRDELRAADADGCLFVCALCGAVAHLLRIEPIR